MYKVGVCVCTQVMCVLWVGFVVKTLLLSMIPGLVLGLYKCILLHIIVGTFLLNQVHGWFLEITFSAGVYVCVCVYGPRL